jgi:hypothetical protein
MLVSATRARITYPTGQSAPFFSSATILEEPTVPITYTLFNREGDAARFVKAYYSLDNGSQWHPAVAATGTVTTNLAASPIGTVHTYNWDVYASGVFGTSDSTIFRLDVYQGFAGPGPYQYPFRTSRTLPFRVRGSQIRVISGTVPVSQALVYRGTASPTGTYEPYRNSADRPFRTNPTGYLQGRGEIAVGDRLMALAPITATESYTLYYASARPTLIGLVTYIVTALGVQTLTVSSANPLILFNLDISLVWDARYDEQFMSQLEFNLQRTSPTSASTPRTKCAPTPPRGASSPKSSLTRWLPPSPTSRGRCAWGRSGIATASRAATWARTGLAPWATNWATSPSSSTTTIWGSMRTDCSSRWTPVLGP